MIESGWLKVVRKWTGKKAKGYWAMKPNDQKPLSCPATINLEPVQFLSTNN